jgi:small subunit ribosomal protein S17
MDKTVVVEVTRRVQHRRYKKYINRTRRFSAHDENNEYAVNDIVIIRESRPLSRTKRWRVVEKANA